MPSLAHFFGANWWILNLMIESGWGSASVEVSEWARQVSENYILPSPGNTYFILWYLHPIVLISPNPFPLALISHKKKLDKKKKENRYELFFLFIDSTFINMFHCIRPIRINLFNFLSCIIYAWICTCKFDFWR